MSLSLGIQAVWSLCMLFFKFFLHYCFSVVKTRKEAERLAKMDSIAAQKARVEQLKRNVEEQRAKRDQYATIVSQQSLGIFLEV